jgi:hypothetical protein
MKYVVTIIVIILCTGAGFFVGNKFKWGFLANNAEIDIRSTVRQVLPASEYASLVYHYSSVITHNDVKTLFDHAIPLTEKKLIYIIDGTIKLGFDGKDIKVDKRYNQIIIRMPQIKILSHEVYPETFSLYDEKAGLFNRYNAGDFNSIQMNHKKDQEKKVNENTGLFTQARQSAEHQFRVFLENLPVKQDDYTIVFEWEL